MNKTESDYHTTLIFGIFGVLSILLLLAGLYYDYLKKSQFESKFRKNEITNGSKDANSSKVQEIKEQEKLKSLDFHEQQLSYAEIVKKNSMKPKELLTAEKSYRKLSEAEKTPLIILKTSTDKKFTDVKQNLKKMRELNKLLHEIQKRCSDLLQKKSEMRQKRQFSGLTYYREQLQNELDNKLKLIKQIAILKVEYHKFYQTSHDTIDLHGPKESQFTRDEAVLALNNFLDENIERLRSLSLMRPDLKFEVLHVITGKGNNSIGQSPIKIASKRVCTLRKLK